MTDTIFTTLAPTTRLNRDPRPLLAIAHEVDRIQANFNSDLFHSINRKELLPISNCLYDIFTLLEQQTSTAPAMLVELLARMKASDLRYLAMMQDAIGAVGKLINAYPALFEDEPDEF